METPKRETPKRETQKRETPITETQKRETPIRETPKRETLQKLLISFDSSKFRLKMRKH